MALDQGTTNTKAILVEATTGRIRAVASRPVDVRFPAPGWVEQDAAQLWQTTVRAATECLTKAKAQLDQPLAGIAITNQRESAVIWSRRTGAPLGPVLGWQDARTASSCADLMARRPDAADLVRSRTGLTLDPMFSAPKLGWLIEAALAAGADRRDILVGTVDSWLIWNLTGHHRVEVGNASRTLLFGLESLTWQPDLADLFGLPQALLPEVVGSDGDFGQTTAASGLPPGIPVLAVLADSHAALYQHGCTQPGTGKATYGTGSSVMTPCLEAASSASSAAAAGIATTVAWAIDGEATYAREGNIIAAGAALDWMARTLGAPAGPAGGAFLTGLAEQVSDGGGVSFVPAFSGLGAPYWDRSATGILTGLTAGATPGHLAWAALESLAHQVVDVVEAIESDGRARIDTLQADGGATGSGLLMQLQADLLGRAVVVAQVPEASALGAARLAARKLGLEWPDDADAAADADADVVRPRLIERDARRQAWVRAVARSRGQLVAPVRSGSPPAAISGVA